MRMTAHIAVVFTCLAALAGNDRPPAMSAAIDVRSEDLLVQPPTANWISYNGDYSGRRYQRPVGNQPGNLAGLRAEWVFHARNSSRLEVTPVVVNGMMFVTAANDASALDARTGREVWHHSWPISEGLIDDASGHINRGVRLWHDRVYMETDNAHLLCLDVRSGNLDLGRGLCGLEQELRCNQRAAGGQRQSAWWGPPAAMTACEALLPPTMQ